MISDTASGNTPALARTIIDSVTTLTLDNEDADLCEKLPQNLDGWRVWGGELEHGIALWELFRASFLKAGIELWRHDTLYLRANNDRIMLTSGFAYVTPVRGDEWITWLRKYAPRNASTWMGTTQEGHNVAIRIVSVRDEGKEHMQILRRIGRGNISMYAENHTAPLWGEVEIGDFGFAVTPLIGHNMRLCYRSWAKNSVGDIMDMIIQALEALAFIHNLGIVHRDAEKDNFLVQWHPESLTTMQVPTCRPRVFLIDFEGAHEFPADTPEESRRLTGPPWEGYRRQCAPEVALGPYDPFKVDVWHLAHSLSDFSTTVDEIDKIMELLRIEDPTCRLTAAEGQEKLATIVNHLSPVSLLIPPLVSKIDL